MEFCINNLWKLKIHTNIFQNLDNLNNIYSVQLYCVSVTTFLSEFINFKENIFIIPKVIKSKLIKKIYVLWLNFEFKII
jgi:hypothetical protein